MDKKAFELLRCAADALSIADDWNLHNVQVHPPKEWKLNAEGEDPKDGWVGTQELSNYINLFLGECEDRAESKLDLLDPEKELNIVQIAVSPPFNGEGSLLIGVASNGVVYKYAWKLEGKQRVHAWVPLRMSTEFGIEPQ